MKRNLLHFFVFLLVVSSSAVYAKGHITVHEHGYWCGEGVAEGHRFDKKLSEALAQFFISEKAQSVVDLGCGTGEYVKVLLKHNLYSEGYDGSPDIFQISGGVAHVADLSQPVALGREFDWVLSLEVGEHIPKRYEQTFIENIHRHNKKGVVLSWAVKGQSGLGHCNTQNNDYIKSIFARYGYVNDIQAETALRKQSTFSWFKNTIMVFRRV